MSLNLGASALKKLTTGRLYWQPPGQAGWTDFGNCVEYKDDPKIERVQHMQGAKGFRRLDFALFKVAAIKKTFTFDEHFLGALALIYMSNQFPQLTQTPLTADSSEVTADNSNITADGGNPANENIEAELTAVAFNAAYNLGRQGVTIVSAVDGHDNPLVQGTDYSLDGPSGMLTVLDNAPVGPWTIVFTCLIVTDNVLNAFSNLLEMGSFKLVEFDQFSPVPRNVETFSGEVYVTGWGENKTDNFNEYTVEVLHQNSLRYMRAT